MTISILLYSKQYRPRLHLLPIIEGSLLCFFNLEGRLVQMICESFQLGHHIKVILNDFYNSSGLFSGSDCPFSLHRLNLCRNPISKPLACRLKVIAQLDIPVSDKLNLRVSGDTVVCLFDKMQFSAKIIIGSTQCRLHNWVIHIIYDCNGL